MTRGLEHNPTSRNFDQPEQQSSGERQEEYRYIAFISYRHLPEDEAIAREVQRSIEAYRLPPNMPGVADRTSRKLGKCFRDDDELTVGPSLPDAIHDALSSSRNLIVICSPETAKSAWVLQEIETFAQLHGRERIFTVLASGDSKESVPPILRPRSDIRSEIGGVHPSPLSADLRSTDRHHRKNELLRLIAAVIGCDYDSLRQRERTRRRKRMATLLLMIATIALLFIAIAAWALAESSDARIAETQHLAERSAQELAQGERMQAIRSALSAATAAMSLSPEHPAVSEAKDALEAALEANPDPDDLWRPSFTFDAANPIVRFAARPSSEWGYALDESGTLDVFSMANGTLHRSIDIGALAPDQDFIADEWDIEAIGAHKVIAANREGNGSLSCFDAESGSLIWSHENAIVSSLAVSDDEASIVIFSVVPETGLVTSLIDTNDGRLLSWSTLEDPAFLSFPISLPSCFDSVRNEAWLATGDVLVRVDLATGVASVAQVVKGMTWSIVERNDRVLLASSERSPRSDGLDLPCAATACNATSLDILWSMTSTYDYETIGPRYDSTAVEGNPLFCGFLEATEPAVAFSAGRTMYILSLADGHEIARKEFSAPLVGAICTPSDTSEDWLCTIAADGTLDIWFPMTDIATHGDGFRATLPHDIQKGAFFWRETTGLQAVLHSATDQGRLFVYHLDTRRPDEAESYELDELMAIAHDILLDP